MNHRFAQLLGVCFATPDADRYGLGRPVMFHNGRVID
jgi:hypothetical protein